MGTNSAKIYFGYHRIVLSGDKFQVNTETGLTVHVLDPLSPIP